MAKQNIASLFVIYKFIQQLSKDWEDWEAYKLGLIDNKGKRLRKAKTPEEHAAMPVWKVFVRNIKHLLTKLPFGQTKLAAFASALYLIKEDLVGDEFPLEMFEKDFTDWLLYVENRMIIPTQITESINTLKAGKYSYGKHVLLVREDTSSFATCLGTELFKAEEILTKETFVVTAQEIKRI